MTCLAFHRPLNVAYLAAICGELVYYWCITD
jgi:hypothetical protein